MFFWAINDLYCIVSLRWFSRGIPVSSTFKTDHNDINEILFKVALNTINFLNRLPRTQLRYLYILVRLWLTETDKNIFYDSYLCSSHVNVIDVLLLSKHTTCILIPYMSNIRAGFPHIREMPLKMVKSQLYIYLKKTNRKKPLLSTVNRQITLNYSPLINVLSSL